MHSKRLYKILICPVVRMSENCSDASLHLILESENVRLPFSKIKSVTWVVKFEKLNFRKVRKS